jgi:hypothetical protein
MQIALLATLLLAAVWFVALRPKSTTGGGESATAPAPAAQASPAAPSGAAPGTAGLTGAVDRARDAVTTADGDAARAEQSSAEAGDGVSVPATRSGPGDASNPATRAPAQSADATRPGSRPAAARGGARAHRAAGSPQVRAVRTAVREHRAVAIAFVDPRTADARAVAQEIGHVSNFGGRAVTLAVPLARLSAYDFITNEVQVTVAPTVVIVDPRRRATTIVGFADRGEIEQRLADALAVRRRGR